MQNYKNKGINYKCTKLESKEKQNKNLNCCNTYQKYWLPKYLWYYIRIIHNKKDIIFNVL